MGSKTFFEPLESVLERMNSGASSAGMELTDDLYECYLRDLLKLNLAEWAAVVASSDYASIEEQAGWAEGECIGTWAQQNPPNKQS